MIYCHSPEGDTEAALAEFALSDRILFLFIYLLFVCIHFQFFVFTFLYLF